MTPLKTVAPVPATLSGDAPPLTIVTGPPRVSVPVELFVTVSPLGVPVIRMSALTTWSRVVPELTVRAAALPPLLNDSDPPTPLVIVYDPAAEALPRVSVPTVIAVS